MSAQYTPGPWALSKDGSGALKNEANCITGADGKLIVYGQANDADARLIAAAPDLLAALKLADCLLSGKNMNRTVVERVVRAAITKATGGTE